MTPEQWEQIGQLYHAARALEPAERAAFLAGACAGAEDLRREVESLFAVAASVGDFIAAPAVKDAAALLTAESALALAGQSLGPYRILSLIGAGGMGQVYAATDTRLGRKVAIKLLPAAFAHNAERLQRFEQEARAVGMLNHPNILTMHDVGTHESMPYIVSELLEGETLRERLKAGALSARKASDFAVQIARGLAAAHERALVHRDLKPENLFITKDGRVKILDFGLAKLKEQSGRVSEWESGRAEEPCPHAPTLPLTNPGAVMGTVGYMSPEQVRGEEADTRADLFAFGIILYEMLAGAPPFRGASAVETLNAILTQDPPELPAPASAQASGLERVLRRCLEKRPEQRFQSASDLGFALEALLAPSGEHLADLAQATGRSRWRERSAWMIATGVLAVLLALAVAYFKRPALEAEAVRLSVSPPEKTTRVGNPAISPDGRRLAFSATVGGKDQLWVRALGSVTAQPLAGTEDASYPFWSPDSQFIGFFAQGKLKKIALSGGPPVTLGDALVGRGGAWSRAGVILFAPNQYVPLQRVSAAGGPAAVMLPFDQARREVSHRWPCFLPDGSHFLFFALDARQEEAWIYLASLDGRELKRLIAAESNAVYAAAAGKGYLLFVREGRLLAQPFDAAERQLRGEPFQLADRVLVNARRGKGAFTVSDNGVLAYSSSDRSENERLGWFDRAGKPLGAIGSAGIYNEFNLSPNEKRVAVTRYVTQPDFQSGIPDVWLLDLVRGTNSRFTFDPGYDYSPIWAPDGSRIVWTSGREAPPSLYQKAASGATPDEPLLRSANRIVATDWSTDGRFICFEEADPKAKWDLWLLPLAGERKPFPWLRTPFNETHGHFSPDAKWLAYDSDLTGSNEVYVQAVPTPGGKWQISAKGGRFPRWRRAGKELFYVAADQKLMAVEVKNGASFAAGVPRALFDLRSINWVAGRNYAVTGDGQRFLVVTSVEEANVAPFTVVLNWTAESKR